MTKRTDWRLPDSPRFRLWNHPDIQWEGPCVVYWMQRSQRILHNPAWEFAVEQSRRLQLPLVVLFALDPAYPDAQIRHFHFMMQGLDELAQRLLELKVPFIQVLGNPGEAVCQWLQQWQPALLIGDDNPLRHGKAWRQQVAAAAACPFVTVDADVIVPTQLLPKEEYAARTIRPKIHRLWDEAMKPWETVRPPHQEQLSEKLRQQHISQPSTALGRMAVAERAGIVRQWLGGTEEAQRRLETFVTERLPTYDTKRNQPAVDGTSGLSPYLHFGQIGPHTVAWAVQEASAPDAAKDAFLEEMIVRRELAVNFITHNSRYDSLAGCHSWAQTTLREHWHDAREYVYSLEQLESASTHDPLWNASQRQLVREGWMHGYMRMYWAKKILHWTSDPAEALTYAVDLNDTYQLDGRDPNGYTGIAWAIGGKHDRAWGPEREIFGKIRYMSYESTRRKFDSRSYIERYS